MSVVEGYVDEYMKDWELKPLPDYLVDDYVQNPPEGSGLVAITVTDQHGENRRRIYAVSSSYRLPPRATS